MGWFFLQVIWRCRYCARILKCTKRTLQRYLREEANTTYQSLLDEVRFDLVQQYLRNSYMPVTQIAYVAGFSDPSNFARAFRKRQGLSPRAWRLKYQDRPPAGKSPVLS